MKEITRSSLEVAKAIGTQALVESTFASGCFTGTVILSTLAVRTVCQLLKCTPEGRALYALACGVLVLGEVSSVAGAVYIDNKCGLTENTENAIAMLEETVRNENILKKVSAREVKIA